MQGGRDCLVNGVAALLALVVTTGCSSAGPSEPTTTAHPASAIRLPKDKNVVSVVYSHRPDGDLSLDIIKPKADKNLHLGIVLIHGGGWVGGNRADMDSIGHYLAEKGFLTASIDYRLAPKNVWPAQLIDAAEAVRYLRGNAKDLGISSKKIGAIGISAGGHLSLFLGTLEPRVGREEVVQQSSLVQAVGSISGIHDLNSPLTEVGNRYRIVETLLGEQGAVDKKARADASPITFVNTHTAPTMFIQGKVDPLVPPEQTTQAEAKLKSLGVPTEAVFVDGMGHGLSPVDARQAAALDKLADWMKKYLG